MQVHASCAALDGVGVLLTGPSGSGKSDLLLRLLDRGFRLVADDRVDIVDGIARAPETLAGLLEVRGIGIIRLPFLSEAQLVLSAHLSRVGRMPHAASHLGLPLVHIDAALPSAPDRVVIALRCARGEVGMLAGAFA